LNRSASYWQRGSLLTDDALIRAAHSGDADAFEQLLEAHYDTLYRFAYKWSGDRADAENITQQACIKLAGAIASYRFEAAFTSWLYRVVVNCARDWARDEGRHRAEEAAVTDQPVAPERGNPEHRAYLWQLLSRLDALPDGVKETLLLVHAEGLTHREAASVLNVKESTVSWRLRGFRKHCHLALDGESFSHG
jgi:RNA polymerase sigma-70 factor (ECF subfamily)